jgi:hypothetical protein
MARSGPAVAADCQDDVAGLLLALDVSRRVDHLLQRVAPVDDRLGFPRLDELFEEGDVLTSEDRRGLTPLFWPHVLPYGEVKLNMNSRLTLGGS